jgi:hypothetical protein
MSRGTAEAFDMSSIQTNRDLYLAITELIGQQQTSARSLEEYLRALREAARKYRERPSLAIDEFYGLLSGAFTLPVPPLDPAWRSPHPPAPSPKAGEGEPEVASLPFSPSWERGLGGEGVAICPSTSSIARTHPVSDADAIW